MANEPTNADIMRELGSLSEGMRGVRRELDAASQSRSVLYDRIDAQGKEISQVSAKVDRAAEEATAARADVKTLTDMVAPVVAVRDDVPKLVETWRDVNKTTKRLVWILSIGGVGTLGTLIFIGDMIRTWFLTWLGLLPPPHP